MAHILIVDDEMNIRKVVREYAEFEGYEVTEAENGMEAVNLCHDNDYDLIIMDVMMPRLDGYSACKEIQKIKKKNLKNLMKLVLTIQNQFLLRKIRKIFLKSYYPNLDSLL